MPAQSRVVVCQKWSVYDTFLPSGSEPCGFSLHISENDLKEFVSEYWSLMPDRVPEEYKAPTGKKFLCEVGARTLNAIQKSKNGIFGFGRGPSSDERKKYSFPKNFEKLSARQLALPEERFSDLPKEVIVYPKDSKKGWNRQYVAQLCKNDGRFHDIGHQYSLQVTFFAPGDEEAFVLACVEGQMVRRGDEECFVQKLTEVMGGATNRKVSLKGKKTWVTDMYTKKNIPIKGLPKHFLGKANFKIILP